MDKQPDELILQSLRQGSYDAFDALYMRYAPHVEAFAFCMLKNRSEAEDLAHDIFLKIWETRESIGRIKSFRSYLFRMTKNAVFDIFEHKNVQTRYEQRLLHVEDLLTDDISTKVATEDLLMIIDMAVEQMPEQRQRVFRLSRYEGLSHQQIAQKLGVTPKTVEYHILAGGSDSILFSGRRTYRRSLVKRCPRNVVKRHIHTICLMVYDLYYSGMKDEFRTQYARLREIDAGVSERAAVHFLGTMTNFNNLDPMITGAEEALDTIRRYNLWKEFKTPHLGFCCPTLLLLYHSTPGQLLTEVEKLAELQSTLERIGRHEYGSAWSHLFHAEYYLLTGDWEKGLGELSALEASPGYANPSVKIRSAYLRGWLAFVTGRASSIREIETEMHGYLASTAGYQTLIASLSECGFHLMFGTDSNIKKEYKRILDPQRFYFPSHTYIES